MKKKIETGGAAFPSLHYEDCEDPMHNELASFDGMTLRDYFAAKAMAGAFASWMNECTNADYSAKGLASESYLIADAMIAERNKEGAE